ncbi:Transmembrane protein [Parasponia andersonii]|uniref:Transmembrane protein n=1 Tax=Parasponia andersonii TaxID=3476 RepID=A0A2P5BBE8_PARAD|nr:Transmembrane protein [Parasponia andersonii]
MDRTVFEAAASGDFDPIERLKEKQILELLTPQMSTILHISVRFNQHKFTEQLLNLCPRLLLKANAAGETPLHIAARVGNQEMVRLLIDCAGDVERAQADARNMLRMRDLAKEDTALHVGVRNGHLGVAMLLIDADRDSLDVFNKANESPLFLAVEGGFLDIAEHIMEKCRFTSPPTCRGSNGMNALHAAVIRTRHAIFLEHHVPDLSLENLRRLIRSFLLHLEEFIGRLPQKTEIDIIGLLLEREETQKAALLEQQDNLLQWTPLHYAAFLGHLEATKLILQQKFSSVAYLKDKEGMSALHIAAKEGHVRVMREIVHQKPEACDLVDIRGWTPLHVAVVNGKLRVVKYILNTPRLEFMLNVADKDGNTPLHLAAGCRKQRIIKILVEDYRVDKRATNLRYLKPIDIVRTNANIGELVRSWLIKKLERQGGQESLQSIVHRVERGNQLVTNDKSTVDNSEEEQENNDDKGVISGHHHIENPIKSRRLKKILDTHLLVAALIATVTFTAAFTIPGGYENDNSDHIGKGMAVLSNESFFKVFVVADSVAFYCSTASVLLQFFSSVEHNYHLLLRFTKIAAALTYISIFGMVVAFTSGLRVVMPSSSSLAEYTLIMGGCCVFLFIIGCL